MPAISFGTVHSVAERRGSSFLRELIIRIYSPLFEIAAESSAELIHLAHFAGKLGYVIPPKAGFVNAHRGPPLRHIPPV